MRIGEEGRHTDDEAVTSVKGSSKGEGGRHLTGVWGTGLFSASVYVSFALVTTMWLHA